jgi:hypothetical protein
MQLPEYILWKIWTYAGPKSYFLDKGLITIIDEKRSNFLKKPLRIHYKLLRWKRKSIFSGSTIKHMGRISRYLECTRYLDVSGCPIGKVDNSHSLQISQKLSDKIIPLSSMYETPHGSRLTVAYWTISSIWIVDIRAILYTRLWPSWKQAYLETS